MAEDAKYRYGDTQEVHIDAPSELSSGEVIIRNGEIGVYMGANTAASGDRVAIATRGVFEFTALTGATWSDGDDLNWDNTGKDVQTGAGDATAGRAVGAKVSGVVVAAVNINA